MNPMSLLALNLRTATMMSEAGTVMQHGRVVDFAHHLAAWSVIFGDADPLAPQILGLLNSLVGADINRGVAERAAQEYWDRHVMRIAKGDQRLAVGGQRLEAEIITQKHKAKDGGKRDCCKRCQLSQG